MTAESARDWERLDWHGDADAVPGLADYAVNVRGSTPPWLLDHLTAALSEIGRYPSAAADFAAREAVATVHQRTAAEVLPLAGAAEGFALLAHLHPQRAVVLAPTFTEPERVLRASGIDVAVQVLAPPWTLDPASVDPAADLVIVGNPTNPTSVLHPAASILALRRPGRIIVVDEAFADTIPGEPESLAAQSFPDVLVLRSLTKTFAIPGIRAGYFLGSPELLLRLSAGRPHWPLGALQLAALQRCSAPDALAYAADQARAISSERQRLMTALRDAAITVAGHPQSAFVLIEVPNGDAVKRALRDRGFAVRSCANFAGLGSNYLRLAVRPDPDPLIAALKEALCD